MGSASRAALAVVRAELDACLGSGSDGQLGVALLTVAAQLDDTPALLDSLADTSSVRSARTRLIERVFAPVSERARRVVTVAAHARWSQASELLDALEELGLRAEAAATPELIEDLIVAAGVIENSHELELALGNKLGEVTPKLILVDRLFGEKLSRGAMNIVRYFVGHPRARRVNVTLRESARVVADQLGAVLAAVTVATPLAEAQMHRLAAMLQQHTGRPVRLTLTIDPTVLGGARVQIGDEVIDGSISSRLNALRLQLAG